MSISKRKKLAIREAGFRIFREVLDSYYNDHNIGGNKWYNTPPDMWLPEEKKIFDALTEFQSRLEENVLKILDKSQAKEQ